MESEIEIEIVTVAKKPKQTNKKRHPPPPPPCDSAVVYVLKRSIVQYINIIIMCRE